MPNESVLQSKLVKALAAIPGVTVLNIVGGPLQQSGYSDLIINWHGLFVAVELKKPGRFGGRVVLPADFDPADRREEVQKRFLIEVQTDGGFAFLSDNLKATIDYLTGILL